MLIRFSAFLLTALCLSTRLNADVVTPEYYRTDFSGTNEFAKWTFNNGPESPGVNGRLEMAGLNGDPALRIYYDKTPPTDGSPYNPSYVMARTTLPTTSNTGEIRFKIRESDPNFDIMVRIYDATGQSFQMIPRSTAILSSDGRSDQWADYVVRMDAIRNYWGGANDGIIRQPIKGFAVLLSVKKTGYTGWAEIDDVIYLVNPEAPSDAFITNTTPIVPSRSTQPLESILSVNVWGNYENLPYVSEVGFKTIRVDLAWQRIEKTLGVYDFANYDALVSRANQAGIRVLYILDYGNTLYGCTPGTSTQAIGPPRTPEALAGYINYVKAAVSRYANSNVVFEIWNEPDVTYFYGGNPDPVHFSQLQRAAIDAIRSVNPNAIVSTSGLGDAANYAFWNVLSQNNGMSGANHLGVHPYIQDEPERRWSDLSNLFYMSKSFVGPSAKVWSTEWGYDTTRLDANLNGASVESEHAQSQMLVRGVLVHWLAGVDLTNIYNLRNNGVGATNRELNFGLYYFDWSPKPAQRAVKNLLARVKGYRLEGVVPHTSVSPGLNVLRLKDASGGQGRIYVVWTEKFAKTSSVTLPLSNAIATDVYGNQVALETTAVTAKVTLADRFQPLFVQGLQPVEAVAPSNIVINVSVGP